jgi:guanosine-3',5'-bis(diphosphate) 3'-pyrophosphohydrolase
MESIVPQALTAPFPAVFLADPIPEPIAESVPEPVPTSAFSAADADDPLFTPLADRLAVYLKPDDITKIETAYHFAAEVHGGQTRASGEPYIVHPLAVAAIVADWHLDAQAVIAALLHDVVEDTYISKAELAERFDTSVAELVDGLTKLDKLKFRSKEEQQAANFQKMLIAMSSDLRVILIKLADRLHNMRTLFVMRADKRRRIARETLEIYAPIANRIGLNSLYHELEELAFANFHPWRHRVLARAMSVVRNQRRELLTQFQAGIEALLPQWGVVDAEVRGREKRLHSIYCKMVEKKKRKNDDERDHALVPGEKAHAEKRAAFPRIHDLHGFRLVVTDARSCYLALGALHSHYLPTPGRIKDYIAIPRDNGYQSLHTTLIGPGGVQAEVQIRTHEMHCLAESGVAAHWRYKINDKNITDLQQKTRVWLQSLLELQLNPDEASEFLEHIKINLLPDEVFVISPKGQIFNLPHGSTAVDFAYAVHTDVGHRCVGCKINSDLQPPYTELKSGDRVEIITSAYPSPNPAWLSYVRTGRARAKIRNFLKNKDHAEAVALGERLLNLALHPHNRSVETISPQTWERFLRDRGAKSKLEIFADIGLSNRMPVVVARRLLLGEERKAGVKGTAGAGMPRFKIHGGEGMTVQFAHCCQPIPDDEVVGIFRRGKGLEIHMRNCPMVTRKHGSNLGRWVDVEWDLDKPKLFNVTLRILCRNSHGMLMRTANAIADDDCNIQSVVMDEHSETPWIVLHVTMQVRSRTHLAQVIRRVRKVPEVVNIAPRTQAKP